jgi:hypothetical protein
MLFNFPCFIINGTIRNLYINYIDYALSWRIKHAGNKVWRGANIKSFDNGHEARLRKMCMVYESLVAMVHFFIYAIMYILLYYKCRFTYYTLFLCL